MKLAKPFIRLPFAFDAGRLAEEAENLGHSAWKPHPLGLAGNSAVALISREGGDNDDFGGRMRPTPHLRQCRYHQQVMASFGEVLARSRLMKLDAGCEVRNHVDFNYHWYTRVRIHIPVLTRPEVIFLCGGRQIHMAAGECWIFDNWRRHNVLNGSAADRIHLVIDLAGSSRFWKMVREMLQAERSTEDGRVDPQPRFLPYDPTARANIPVENYNDLPVMAPGEVDALVAALIGEFADHPANDPELVEEYRLLLTDFASDWREVWHRHGFQPEGLQHYRKLTERVRQGLHPQRRALVTSSNNVGVNPIIVQRILRAVLAADVHEGLSNGKL